MNGDYAWYYDNANSKTHPVGQKRPNAGGMYDMIGNVWEWCADWYDEKYFLSSPASNPQGPATGSCRVLRGGSWYGSDVIMRSANRLKGVPDNRLNRYGFRCAAQPR
jgi:formylglycine-generating enzyme required for sulfatase activity